MTASTPTDAQPLAGKVAIVTGAGQGLGRAHALELSSLGAAVVVNDLGDGADAVVAEITGAGGKAIANRASVSDWNASKALVGEAVDTFGDLHIVVNNAGFTRDTMSFNMDEAQWDSVVVVHLKGHFCTSRHAGVYWRKQAKAGIEIPRRIINTTSEAGLFGSAGQANYASSKAGIVGLTWVFAKEYGRVGVTANAIAPRARTKMTEKVAMFAVPKSGVIEGFDKFDPRNVSKVVGWLATDATSDISGQTFIVFGGEIHLMSRPVIVGSVKSDGKALSIEIIEASRAELFGGQDLGPAPFGGPM